MIKGKRLIVTGGFGFIGSNLVERVLADNEVLIIDNESTGKFNNIQHLVTDNLKILKTSINDANLTDMFSGYDYVFHQAALPNIARSIENPIGTNDVNISGTLNVLTAAKDADIQKLVYASSSSVYGDSPTLPQSEDAVTSPLSPYAITKLTGELYCKVFHEIYGLPTISLRYFNVFGPRQDPTSQYAAVIPKFVTAMMNDIPPVVFGDGEQSRDFTFVRHVVDANILACESNKTGVFNVACGRRITINGLIDVINELLEKNVKPKYVDPRPGDVKHTLADISKAQSFGYAPRSNFKEELRLTIRWLSGGHSR